MPNGDDRNGENRPTKREFDIQRNYSESVSGRRPEIDIISEWIWGGPGVMGAEEKLRNIDTARLNGEKAHRNLWLGVLIAIALTNPVVGHFVLQWLGLASTH